MYYVAVTDRDPLARPASRRGPRPRPTLACRSSSSGSIKNLTADGYYTSRAGLLEELGYSGNTVLGAFPACPEQ